MRKTAQLQLAALVLALAGAAAAQRDRPEIRESAEEPETPVMGFKVVVNAANPLRELTVRDLQRIFYKNTTRWEGWLNDDKAVTVTPIDRERGAEVRKLFSKKVFKKSASAIESYWQRQIFSGDDIPPDKLATELDVLEFVRRNRGAIGYVSRDAELGDGVKELTIKSD